MASQRPPSPDAALDADHTDARRHLRRSSLEGSGQNDVKMHAQAEASIVQ